jgi:DNA-binding NarL/FixJ family response regulator
MCVSSSVDPVGQPPAALSDRQVAILRLMAQGDGVDTIAAELRFSVSTIKKEIHRVTRQLGARNRTQAVAIAIRSGAV